jgi:type I restriction enzyme S subunit
MNWRSVTLPDLVGDEGLFVDGDWVESKDQDPNGDVRLVQLADIGVGEYLDKSARFMTSKKATQLKCSYLKEGDVLIARMPDPIGRACLFPGDTKPCVTVVDVCILRPDDQVVDRKWLLHKINSPIFRNEISQWVTGTTRQRISRGNLSKIEFPLPPLEEQKRIAAILDQADAIRRKREESLQLADAFLRSVFLDMFGDPVTNPKGWKVGSLTNFGSFKNGLNYNKGENGVRLRYLGVGDFGSRSQITDIESLSFIELDKLPPEEFLLRNGDLVFVRSNGNKQLVGRCLSVTPDNEAVTYSGFCIRYRIESQNIDQNYLRHLFRVPTFRKVMLQGGQGANIQNINQKILSNLNIPTPPLDLQHRFAAIVESVEQQKARIREQLAEAEGLFASLQQRAFKGEL